MTTNIGIVSKPGRSDLPQLLRELTAWLDARGVAWAGDVVTETYLGRKGGFNRTTLEQDFDLIVVLGGDGLMMRSANAYPDVPLLGINFGKVGFLAMVERRASPWARPAAADHGASLVLVDGQHTLRPGACLPRVHRAGRAAERAGAIHAVRASRAPGGERGLPEAAGG